MEASPNVESLGVYKALYDCLPYEVHVWQVVYDDHGEVANWRLLDANPQALASWSASLGEVVGRTAEEIFPGSTATEQFLPVVRRILASGKPFEWEEAFSGTGQLLHMVSIPLDGAFISCGADVSRYHQTEEQLRKKSRELEGSLKRLELATGAANFGVWELDLRSSALTWDESMHRIYGVELPADSLAIQSWAGAVDPDDLPRVEAQLAAAVESDALFESEFRIIRQNDGAHRYIAAQGGVERAADGTPARMIGINLDVTERHELEQELGRKVAQLDRALDQTLETVALMVELRDPYTAGHERLVGRLAEHIGRELGWPENRCKTLRMAGIVHDIGKIGIPAEILVKPAALSEDEYALVKSHAENGFAILEKIDFERPIADIVLQHHERLDGSGYPAGLAGDAILPEARVIAAADVIESMASHRPYRPALGIEAALAELQAGSGRLYDPDIVTAVARIHARGELPQLLVLE